MSGNDSAIAFIIVFSIFLGVLLTIGGVLWRTFNSMFGVSSMLQPPMWNAERNRLTFSTPSRPVHSDDDIDLRPRVAPKEVAQRAMRRANNQPSDWLLSLEDIGVLAYHGDDTPDVVRLNPVAADTTHLRPFAVIRIPYKQGRGTIRFELFDELGTRRFVSSEQYLLKEGDNFITPRTYMPLPDERTSGMWTLRLSIGDKRFAEHEFAVRARTETPVRALIVDDGEVDPWMARAIVEQGRQGSGMSLDELLADQSDERQSSSRLR
jgi:hypothetical protein